MSRYSVNLGTKKGLKCEKTRMKKLTNIVFIKNEIENIPFELERASCDDELY